MVPSVVFWRRGGAGGGYTVVEEGRGRGGEGVNCSVRVCCAVPRISLWLLRPNTETRVGRFDKVREIRFYSGFFFLLGFGK